MISPQLKMKALYNFLLCLLWVILLGCGGIGSIQNIRKTDTTAEKIDAQELTFMTYNIRAGGGSKNPGMSPSRVMATKENLLKVATAIKSADPDIVGLQEVRGYNQVKFLAEKLNMNFAYSAHAGSKRWGLAVLSKFNIIDIRAKQINFGTHKRIALMSIIDINGKTIDVLNVHYALENYNGQIKATMKFLETAEDPVVLMGDLNRRFFRKEMTPLKQKLLDTCTAINTKGSQHVQTAGTGFGRIDYIFVDQKFYTVLDVGIALGDHIWASDHYAYWAKVKLKN